MARGSGLNRTDRRPLQGADVEEGEQLSTAMTEAVQRFEMLLQRHRRTGAPFIYIKHNVCFAPYSNYLVPYLCAASTFVAA
jgi:hypothetical protein